MKQPHEYIATCTQFEKIFRCRFPDYEDRLLKVLGRVAIDIIAFDILLHQRFGNYEDNGKSMQDIIAEKYGEAAGNFIKELL